MFKKKEKREEFSTFARTMDKLINSKDAAEKRAYEYEGKMHQYHQQLWEMQQENAKLIRENECIRMLFDKESDTQVVKYQGELYRILSINHYNEMGVDEKLDISLVPVGEVKLGGKSKM